MVGLAKKLFKEKTGAFLSKSDFFSSHHEWPLLEAAFQKQCISYADIETAKRLLGTVANASQASAILICHLSACARKGHLCANISKEFIYPSVKDIWSSGNDDPFFQKEVFQLHDSISKELIAGTIDIEPFLACESSLTAFSTIYRHQTLYYLQRYWKLEREFVENIRHLINCKCPLPTEESLSYEKVIHALLADKKLLPEQADAIKQGCLYPLTMIIGGPGTGKTYTAGLLIKVLWESLSKVQKASYKIALAAPTGKAAANLEGSIQRAMGLVEGFPKLSAQTLHALLGKGKHTNPNVSADLLLVDEASMIDACMMTMLVKSLKPGARLIMLGDKHQLPPVETGALFAEMVDMLQMSPKHSSKVVELKTCVRTELKVIVEIAEAIKEGSIDRVLRLLEANQNAPAAEKVHFEPLKDSSIKDCHLHLLNHCLPKYALKDDQLHNPALLLTGFSKFRLLTPLKKGPFGVETLNKLFYEAAWSRSMNSDYLIIPIMIEKNDYQCGLFNGDVGLLIKQRSGGSRTIHKNDYAIFASKQNNVPQDVRKFPALLLPKFDYAYALSIHKSQGSEFEHVLLIVPEGSAFFGREALYTGVTRAKQRLEVWGSLKDIELMLSTPSRRQSGLNQFEIVQ